MVLLVNYWNGWLTGWIIAESESLCKWEQISMALSSEWSSARLSVGTYLLFNLHKRCWLQNLKLDIKIRLWYPNFWNYYWHTPATKTSGGSKWTVSLVNWMANAFQRWKVMHFGRHNALFNYTLDSKLLVKVSEETRVANSPGFGLWSPVFGFSASISGLRSKLH